MSPEAEKRTNIIENELRNYRLSCAPSQLLEAKGDLWRLLEMVSRQHTQYILTECELILRSLIANATPGANSILNILRQRSGEVSNNCVGLLHGIAEEILMAAETDKLTATEKDRPTYAFNNHIHGPVGAVAQGEVSGVSVHQTNTTGLTLPELSTLISDAATNWAPEQCNLIKGAQAALTIESESSEPDPSLIKAAIKRIGSVAAKVTQDAATQALLAYLKTHGY
jgi:hypothetical protein